MKKLLFALLILPFLAQAAPFDILLNQRDSADASTKNRAITPPGGGGRNGIMGYNGATNLPAFLGIGPGLTLSGGTLDAVPGGPVTWASVTGKPTTVSGYGITDAFSGAYGSLSGVPVSFPPSTHTHAGADITSGTIGIARLPALPISQTTGLQSALDAKFSTPTGSASQYVTGTGALATFPAIPAAQVQSDWNASASPAAILNKPALFSGSYSALTGIPSTFAPSAHTQAFSTITATPTSCEGYGILDCVTPSMLTSTLASYATTASLASGLATKLTTPAGTTAQYVRGDGSLATLPTAKRIDVYTGTTNASGQITVTYSTAFPATPVVQPPAPALANQVWTTISSTATGFTLQLNQRNTVTLLSTEVLLGATVPVAGSAATILVVAQ